MTATENKTARGYRRGRNFEAMTTRRLRSKYNGLYRRAFVRGLSRQDERDMGAIARELQERGDWID